MSRCDVAQDAVAGRLPRPLGTAERPVREQADPVVDAIPDDAAQHVGVVPWVQLHLHARDVDDRARLRDLSDGDVAEADLFDQPLPLQRAERAHARRQRRARIGRVQLIQGDPLDAER